MQNIITLLTETATEETQDKTIQILTDISNAALDAAAKLRSRKLEAGTIPLAFRAIGECETKHINGHRCKILPPGPNEGLAVCLDCHKAEVELDEPCVPKCKTCKASFDSFLGLCECPVSL